MAYRDAGFGGRGQGGVEVSTADGDGTVRNFKGLGLGVSVMLRFECPGLDVVDEAAELGGT